MNNQSQPSFTQHPSAKPTEYVVRPGGTVTVTGSLVQPQVLIVHFASGDVAEIHDERGSGLVVYFPLGYVAKINIP